MGTFVAFSSALCCGAEGLLWESCMSAALLHNIGILIYHSSRFLVGAGNARRGRPSPWTRTAAPLQTCMKRFGVVVTATLPRFAREIDRIRAWLFCQANGLVLTQRCFGSVFLGTVLWGFYSKAVFWKLSPEHVLVSTSWFRCAVEESSFL